MSQSALNVFFQPYGRYIGIRCLRLAVHTYTQFPFQRSFLDSSELWMRKNFNSDTNTKIEKCECYLDNVVYKIYVKRFLLELTRIRIERSKISKLYGQRTIKPISISSGECCWFSQDSSEISPPLSSFAYWSLPQTHWWKNVHCINLWYEKIRECPSNVFRDLIENSPQVQCQC